MVKLADKLYFTKDVIQAMTPEEMEMHIKKKIAEDMSAELIKYIDEQKLLDLEIEEDGSVVVSTMIIVTSENELVDNVKCMIDDTNKLIQRVLDNRNEFGNVDLQDYERDILNIFTCLEV